MKLRITAVNHERVILAIKGVRAVTGLGLREAKDIVDDVRAGLSTDVKISGDPFDAMQTLDAHGVEAFLMFEPDDVATSHAATLVGILSAMPPNLRVREVISVLEAAGVTS